MLVGIHIINAYDVVLHMLVTQRAYELLSTASSPAQVKAYRLFTVADWSAPSSRNRIAFERVIWMRQDAVGNTLTDGRHAPGLGIERHRQIPALHEEDVVSSALGRARAGRPSSTVRSAVMRDQL